MSEVSTWVARNWDTVLEYRQQRWRETKTLRDFKDGDCFHDGKDGLLNTVQQNHAELEQSVRNCDRVTVPVLKMIKESMLRSTDSHGRRDVVYIYRESAKLIETASIAEKNIGNLVDHTASQALLQSPPKTSISSTEIMIPPKPTPWGEPLNFDPSPQLSHQSNTKQGFSTIYDGSLNNNGNNPILSLNQNGPQYLHHLGDPPEVSDDEDSPQSEVFRSSRSLTAPQHLEKRKLKVGAPPNTKAHNQMEISFRGPTGLRTEPNNLDQMGYHAGTLALNEAAIATTEHQDLEDHSNPSSQILTTEYQVQKGSPAASPSVARNSRPGDLPVWPAKSALRWRRARKESRNNQPSNKPPERHRLEDLKGRDHVCFLPIFYRPADVALGFCDRQCFLNGNLQTRRSRSIGFNRLHCQASRSQWGRYTFYQSRLKAQQSQNNH